LSEKTLLVLADLHMGASVALCRPVVGLDDGGSYHASAAQLFLWRSWENLLEQVTRKKVGELLLDLNGDIIEGDAKNRSIQLITRNKATLLRHAAEVLDPLVKMSAGLYFKRGTEAHSGNSGEWEEELALDLGAAQCPETNTASWWSMRYEVEGVRFDTAHHPRSNGGGRPQNRFSMIDALASDTVFSYANDRREEPPDLVIRSHIHTYKDSYDHFRTRAITTPCWSLFTAHTYRTGIAPTLPDIGGILIHCSAGRYEVDVIRYQPKPTPFYSIGALQPHDPGI
jgi:hypothetical protein